MKGQRKQCRNRKSWQFIMQDGFKRIRECLRGKVKGVQIKVREIWIKAERVQVKGLRVLKAGSIILKVLDCYQGLREEVQRFCAWAGFGNKLELRNIMLSKFENGIKARVHLIEGWTGLSSKLGSGEKRDYAFLHWVPLDVLSCLPRNEQGWGESTDKRKAE